MGQQCNYVITEMTDVITCRKVFKNKYNVKICKQ